MSKAGYKVSTSSAVALSAATARTALMMITPSSFGGELKKFRIGFDGISASAVPVLWEIVRSTNASNSTPGTGNTTETSNIVQVYGRAITTGFTAFSASTSEPTVLTVLDSGLLTPAGGLLLYDFALGSEFECDVSAGLGIRLTAPASVNARASMILERI
ncbi:hypothetical protein ACFQS1_19735 [Paractinoplanes rhizophilus]|uniref:Uncharacterized protein n=1 Tax=Paractinoplanes rhizophilus TaxID=1416877 RepID=A0ABW2HXB7_9ACTN